MVRNYHDILMREGFVGLSTDTKPDAKTIPIGSKFNEVDTGNWFVTNGTEWIEDLSGGGSGGSSGTIYWGAKQW